MNPSYLESNTTGFYDSAQSDCARREYYKETAMPPFKKSILTAN